MIRDKAQADVRYMNMENVQENNDLMGYNNAVGRNFRAEVGWVCEKGAVGKGGCNCKSCSVWHLHINIFEVQHVFWKLDKQIFRTKPTYQMD